MEGAESWFSVSGLNPGKIPSRSRSSHAPAIAAGSGASNKRIGQKIVAEKVRIRVFLKNLFSFS